MVAVSRPSETEYIAIPHENQPDVLTEAEQVFAPKKPKAAKAFR